MACGCSKKRNKKAALADAKAVIKKKKSMPLITIRKKSLKTSTKK